MRYGDECAVARKSDDVPCRFYAGRLRWKCHERLHLPQDLHSTTLLILSASCLP